MPPGALPQCGRQVFGQRFRGSQLRIGPRRRGGFIQPLRQRGVPEILVMIPQFLDPLSRPIKAAPNVPGEKSNVSPEDLTQDCK